MTFTVMGTSFNTETQAALYLAHEYLTAGGQNDVDFVASLDPAECMADPDIFRADCVSDATMADAVALVIIAAKLASAHFAAAQAEGWEVDEDDVDGDDWSWYVHIGSISSYDEDDLKKMTRSFLA